MTNIHYRDSASKSKSENSETTSEKKEPTHKPQFRGSWVPAEIHYLLQEKKITTTEFALLIIIDSLVDSRGDGCWASSAYLADRIGKSIKHIETMIHHLKELGHIKRVGTKRVGGRDFRILETSWSKIGDKGGPPLPIRGVDPCGQGGSSLADKGERKKGEKEREDGGDSAPPSRNGTSDSRNGFFPTNGTGNHPRQKKELPPECVEWGKTLRKILNNVRPKLIIQDASYVVWAEWMFKLWKKMDKDSRRMNRLFAWFSKHAGEEGLPEITSAKQFHDRADWIERERRKEDGPDQPKVNRRVEADGTIVYTEGN